MSDTVLITGAAGNLGAKLRAALADRCRLRLLDRDPRGDSAIVSADLALPGPWVEQFRGVDVVYHLAADPTANQTWPNLVAPNVDALVHVFRAAESAHVRRIVYASSNHVMGGYKERLEPHRITTDLPPLPGTRYVVDGEHRDSSAYAAAKLFGERLGKALADTAGIEFLAVRFGWMRPGDNRAEDIPTSREAWYRLMWLSNRDYAQLVCRCLTAPLPDRFAVVNGMSNNTGMRWDLDGTRRLLDYDPVDDVARLAPSE